MILKLLRFLAVLAVPLAAQATDYRIIERPHQECWNEQVAQQNGGYGGAILGGLTGGLLGNQVGGGNGRTAATAVGAATGAVVGDRLSGAPGYRTVQRCRTVVDRERVPVYQAYRERVRYVSQPVIEERVYYVEREHHSHHHHWKHHHHDDDDDDD